MLSLPVRVPASPQRVSVFFAGQDGAEVMASSHVQQALDAKVRRADRLLERSYDAIQREFVLVDTDGAAVGQVNGLSVMQLGGFAFGRDRKSTRLNSSN